jgi:hypothetical protein
LEVGVTGPTNEIGFHHKKQTHAIVIQEKLIRNPVGLVVSAKFVVASIAYTAVQ